MNYLHNTLIPLLEQYSSFGGLIAFFASFLETILGFGYFLPGSTIVLLMGLLAGQGVVNIKVILLFAFLGAVAGDWINYFLGRKYGKTIVKISWLHLSNKTLQKADRFFNKYGFLSIFLGRLLPGIKESISFFAGSLHMNFYKFVFWEMLGAFIWSLEFVGIGYIFSNSLSLAQLWLSRSVYILLILLLFFGIFYMLIYFLKQKGAIALDILKSVIRAILNHESIIKFKIKHPKIISFIKNRLDKTNFFGFPFTILVLVFLYVLGLFGGIIEDFLSQDPIVTVDRIVSNSIVAYRTTALTKFFTYITLFGKTEVVIAFLVLTIIILWINNKGRYIYPLLISFTGSIIFMYLSKIIFHRPRPEVAIYYESSYSFPSGHATIAVALYGFVIYLIMHFTKNIQKKFNIFFIGSIFILLIGISRIYLGEHYISDVYSGYLIGTLWVIVAISFTKYIEDKKRISNKKTKYTKFINTILIIIFLIFYILFSNHFHYKKIAKRDLKTIYIKNPIDVFKNRSAFTQSIIGFDSWSINIIFIDNSLNSLKDNLKKVKWHIVKSIKEDLPIYWNYKKAKLYVENNTNKNIYLLKVWKTNYALSKNEHIFVATAIKSNGYLWNFIPKFIPNIDSARDFTKTILEKYHIIKKVKIYQLNKALIGKDILNQNYFSDGKCIAIYNKGLK